MAMDPLPVMNKVFSLVLQFESECTGLDKDVVTQDLISMVRRGNYTPGNTSEFDNRSYYASSQNFGHNTVGFGGPKRQQQNF